MVRNIEISVGSLRLGGNLTIPARATGLVIFAHGSGSSRFSPRNRHVAESLNGRGYATLLLDLLTPDEEAIDEATGRLRFDIDLLAERLTSATDWALGNADTRDFAIGYFGASTGAAAAIIASTKRGPAVRAIVSRGGRVDMAGEKALGALDASLLLIVGERDAFVLAANREAMRLVRAPSALSIVRGAGHLFEEAGALDQVADLAGDWFDRYLGTS